jgi:hypothetical protein
MTAIATSLIVILGRWKLIHQPGAEAFYTLAHATTRQGFQ